MKEQSNYQKKEIKQITDIEPITLDMIRSLGGEDRRLALKRYHAWLKFVRADELRQMKNLESRLWQWKNKEKVNELRKKYREKHKEKIGEKNRSHYAKHRDEILDRQRKRYHAKKKQERKQLTQSDALCPEFRS